MAKLLQAACDALNQAIDSNKGLDALDFADDLGTRATPLT